jgi:hypothetical protein
MKNEHTTFDFMPCNAFQILARDETTMVAPSRFGLKFTKRGSFVAALEIRRTFLARCAVELEP